MNGDDLTHGCGCWGWWLPKAGVESSQARPGTTPGTGGRGGAGMEAAQGSRAQRGAAPPPSTSICMSRLSLGPRSGCPLRPSTRSLGDHSAAWADGAASGAPRARRPPAAAHRPGLHAPASRQLQGSVLLPGLCCTDGSLWLETQLKGLPPCGSRLGLCCGCRGGTAPPPPRTARRSLALRRPALALLGCSDRA